jgi:predicted nucleic acid-binding protein
VSLVVDASAAVEYLLKTRLGLRIAAILEAEPLIAPELLDAEVLSVMRRLTLTGRVTAARGAEVIEDLGEWDLERVPHRPLLHEAWRFRENVTAYDALYLAAASLHGAAVLTADGPLARAPSLGVVVQNARG